MLIAIQMELNLATKRMENVPAKHMCPVTSVPHAKMVTTVTHQTVQVRVPSKFFEQRLINCLILSECDCNEDGAKSCNKETGQCHCEVNIVGKNCDKCSTWYYGSPPECKGMHCVRYFLQYLEYFFDFVCRM